MDKYLNVKKPTNWLGIDTAFATIPRDGGVSISLVARLRSTEQRTLYNKARKKADEYKEHGGCYEDRKAYFANSDVLHENEGTRVSISKTTRDFGDTWEYELLIIARGQRPDKKDRPQLLTQDQLKDLFNAVRKEREKRRTKKMKGEVGTYLKDMAEFGLP